MVKTVQKVENPEGFKVGDKLFFSKYADLGDEEAILVEGDAVKLTEVNEEGVFTVKTKDGREDTVFPDELSATSPVPEKTEGKPNGKTKGMKGTAKVTNIKEARAKKTVAKKTEAKAAKPKTKAKAKTPARTEEAKAQARNDKRAVKTKAKAKRGEMRSNKLVEETVEEPTWDHTKQVKSALRGKDATEVAKTLHVKREEGNHTLGGVLSVILKDKLHEKVENCQGSGGFTRYCEEHVGISYRTARYFIGIYEWSREVDADPAELARLGWTKAKEMAAANVTKEEYPNILKYAEEHTVSEVTPHIVKSREKASKGKTTEPKVTKTRFTFVLFGDEADLASKAVEKAMKDIGTDQHARGFAHMATEWLQLTEGVEVPYAAAVEALEAKYNVKLAEVSDEEGE